MIGIVQSIAWDTLHLRDPCCFPIVYISHSSGQAMAACSSGKLAFNAQFPVKKKRPQCKPLLSNRLCPVLFRVRHQRAQTAHTAHRRIKRRMAAPSADGSSGPNARIAKCGSDSDKHSIIARCYALTVFVHVHNEGCFSHKPWQWSEWKRSCPKQTKSN